MRGKVAHPGAIALACAAAAGAQDACLDRRLDARRSACAGGAARGDRDELPVRVVPGADAAGATFAAAPAGRPTRRSTAATLRRECLRTARQLFRGATCGTNRVACGGVEAVGRRGALPAGGAERAAISAPATRRSPRPRAARRRTAPTWSTGRPAPASIRAVRGPYGVGVRTVTYHQGLGRQPRHAARARHRHLVPDHAGRRSDRHRAGRRHRCARRSVRRAVSAAAVLARVVRLSGAVDLPHPADRLVRIRRRGAAASGQHDLRVPDLRPPAAQAASFQERPQRHHLRDRRVAGRQRRRHVAVLRAPSIPPHRHVGPFVRWPDDVSGAATCDARFRVAVPMAPAALRQRRPDRAVADDDRADRQRS